MNRTLVLRNDSMAQALWALLKQNWRAMAEAGRPLAVTIAEYKAKRSVEQNKRYWVILNEIADNASVRGKRYSAESWHELAKRQFIGMDELPNGEMVGISTTTLNVHEFGEYMAKVEAWAASDLGVMLSDA